MTDFAALGGQRVTTIRAAFPWLGTWAADVVIASSAQIPAQTTLVVGNLTLVGHVLRMASFSGARSARIVGGFGGWPQTLAAAFYGNPAGVRASMVLGDAATLVGEKIAMGSTDRSLGDFFARENAPAARVLKQVAGNAWYIDANGITQLGPRPTGTITSDFQVISWSGAKGRFEIASEDYASWMPARTFTAPTVTTSQTVALTEIEQDNDGRLRLTVLTS